MNQLQTQFMVNAFEAAANIVSQTAGMENRRTQLMALQSELSHRERMLESQLSHDREMFEMKAKLLRDIIASLIERRIEAVQQGFGAMLALYNEQCRHYMAERERYTEAEINATQPLKRANIGARLSENKIELAKIRAEAATIYRHMNKVILLIGGTIPPMPTDLPSGFPVTET